MLLRAAVRSGTCRAARTAARRARPCGRCLANGMPPQYAPSWLGRRSRNLLHADGEVARGSAGPVDRSLKRSGISFGAARPATRCVLGLWAACLPPRSSRRCRAARCLRACSRPTAPPLSIPAPLEGMPLGRRRRWACPGPGQMAARSTERTPRCGLLAGERSGFSKAGSMRLQAPASASKRSAGPSCARSSGWPKPMTPGGDGVLPPLWGGGRRGCP